MNDHRFCPLFSNSKIGEQECLGSNCRWCNELSDCRFAEPEHVKTISLARPLWAVIKWADDDYDIAEVEAIQTITSISSFVGVDRKQNARVEDLIYVETRYFIPMFIAGEGDDWVEETYVKKLVKTEQEAKDYLATILKPEEK